VKHAGVSIQFRLIFYFCFRAAAAAFLHDTRNGGINIIKWMLIIVVSSAAAYFLLVLGAAACVNTNRIYQHDSFLYRVLLNSCMSLYIRCHRLRIHFADRSKLPQDSRFFLICNHPSRTDPIIIGHQLESSRIALFVEQECFQVPVIGRIARRCSYYSADCDDRKEYIGKLLSASARIADDKVSIGMFIKPTDPCSTAALADQLLVAQTAGVPVVALTLSGTENIQRCFPLRRTDIYLHVADLIPADRITSSDAELLAEHVLHAMNRDAARA